MPTSYILNTETGAIPVIMYIDVCRIWLVSFIVKLDLQSKTGRSSQTQGITKKPQARGFASLHRKLVQLDGLKMACLLVHTDLGIID